MGEPPPLLKYKHSPEFLGETWGGHWCKDHTESCWRLAVLRTLNFELSYWSVGNLLQTRATQTLPVSEDFGLFTLCPLDAPGRPGPWSLEWVPGTGHPAGWQLIEVCWQLNKNLNSWTDLESKRSERVWVMVETDRRMELLTPKFKFFPHWADYFWSDGPSQLLQFSRPFSPSLPIAFSPSVHTGDWTQCFHPCFFWVGPNKLPRQDFLTFGCDTALFLYMPNG